MEKEVQHGLVDSIEITEPGERPGLLAIGDGDEARVTGAKACFAVLCMVGAGETARAVAGWLAGAGIVLCAPPLSHVCGLPSRDAVEEAPWQPAVVHAALGVPPEWFGSMR